ncbi:hypothetical protein [Streptomyces sp. NPDC001292]|uniref:hypothetical protein n=1 Tax=Streptomyces sp. NPDC001292 TaxID=3364558 RepID=UPI0036C515E2
MPGAECLLEAVEQRVSAAGLGQRDREGADLRLRAAQTGSPERIAEQLRAEPDADDGLARRRAGGDQRHLRHRVEV